MKISAIQLNSRENIGANLESAEAWIARAKHDDNADLAVLPEYFAYLHDDPKLRQQSGSRFAEIHQRMAACARKNALYVHAGSVVEEVDGSFFNTSVVFSPDGEELARYRKIHLFDADSADGTAHRESDFVARGQDIVTYKIGGLTIGCGICYDLRFPELFAKLRERGADIIVLPAAFTLATGKDHWEILVRARALETQTYLVASGQVHQFAEGRRTSWGHSMIVDPWGHIVAQASDRVTQVTARIEPDFIAQVRAAMPVANHHVLD